MTYKTLRLALNWSLGILIGLILASAALYVKDSESFDNFPEILIAFETIEDRGLLNAPPEDARSAFVVETIRSLGSPENIDNHIASLRQAIERDEVIFLISSILFFLALGSRFYFRKSKFKNDKIIPYLKNL